MSTTTVIEAPRPRSRRQVFLIVGLLAAALVPLFRQTGMRPWSVIYPEDGSIYTQQALASNPFSLLLRGYAGYLQLPPRLLALVVPLLPVRHLPLYFAVVGSLTVALLAWFAFWASEDWVASVPLRLALAALVVVAPVMGVENTANITNTIWAFVVVAPWALISLREDRRATAIRAGVVFLGATASALAFLLVPLAIGWLVVRRTRSAVWVAGSFGFGLILQAVVTLRTDRPTNPFIPTGGTVAQLRDRLTYRVFGEFAVGDRWLQPLWRANWRAVEILAVLIVVAVVVCLLPGAGRRAQVMSIVFVGYAVAMFLVPLWGRGATAIRLVEGGEVRPASMRFSVIPCFLLASAVAMLLASPERRAASWVRNATWVFVAQVAILVVVNFSSATPTSGLNDWRHGVDVAYQQQCVGHPPGSSATIPESLFPVDDRLQPPSPVTGGMQGADHRAAVSSRLPFGFGCQMRSRISQKIDAGCALPSSVPPETL